MDLVKNMKILFDLSPVEDIKFTSFRSSSRNIDEALIYLFK